MTGGRNDPRPARSRARLLDAATALLRSGGPSAVTVDAVTRAANVARATLYRHFPSGNDLLAAAFHALIPPAPMPPDEGSLRDRLIAAGAGSGRVDRRGARHPDRDVLAGAGRRSREVARRNDTAARTTAPRCRRFVNASPSSTPRPSTQSSTARRRSQNWAMSTAQRRPSLLLGPIAVGQAQSRCRTSTTARSRVVAVDGFLATHRKKADGLSAASSESAGA